MEISRYNYIVKLAMDRIKELKETNEYIDLMNTAYNDSETLFILKKLNDDEERKCYIASFLIPNDYDFLSTIKKYERNVKGVSTILGVYPEVTTWKLKFIEQFGIITETIINKNRQIMNIHYKNYDDFKQNKIDQLNIELNHTNSEIEKLKKEIIVLNQNSDITKEYNKFLQHQIKKLKEKLGGYEEETRLQKIKNFIFKPILSKEDINDKRI